MNKNPDPHNPNPAAPQRRGLDPRWLIVVLTTAVCVVVLAALVASRVFYPQEKPLLDRERPLLIVATDFVEFAPGLVIRTDAEGFRKTVFPDDTVQLLYEYRPAAGGNGDSLTIRCNLLVYPDRLTARNQFESFAAFPLDIPAEPASAWDFSAEDVLLPIGDRSQLTKLNRDGQPAGWHLLVRVHNKIYAVAVLDNGDIRSHDLLQLVTNKLPQVKDYQP